MAVRLKPFILGSMIVIFENLFTFLSWLFTILPKRKKLPPLKHILALSMQGQKSIVLELETFEKENFHFGQPVSTLSKKHIWVTPAEILCRKKN